jgi:HlyD family secretion protein
MSRLPWLLLPLVLACRPGAPPPVEATGTIEVRELDVAPLLAARVLEMRVDEGDAVRRGDTLALLTQSTTRADIAHQEARLGAAQAILREALAGAQRREIERAEAELRMRDAEAGRAARDLERIRPLAAQGAMSPQALDEAEAAAATAAARRDAAVETLQLLRDGTRPERVQAARAEVASARASLSASRAVADDMVLLAPVDGLVLSRNAEPGERLAAGESALTLGETARPWVRVFVPTASLPRVRNGQAATARLDGFPDRPIPGRVIAIDPDAEFTPRVAMTERERADLVFGVKVALEDTAGLVRPGLPATVRFHEAPAGE